MIASVPHSAVPRATPPSVHSVWLLLALAGCSTVPTPPGRDSQGVDGLACKGDLAPVVPGLAESRSAVLLERAQMPSGKGGLCAAKVFAVTAPVTLYRVFDSARPHTKFGAWWSLKPPGGSREDYRVANAICPEWSPLDRVVSCELRPGTQLVLGTTQSAECRGGLAYAPSPELQVYVPNDVRVGVIHVGNCSAETPWPVAVNPP